MRTSGTATSRQCTCTSGLAKLLMPQLYCAVAIAAHMDEWLKELNSFLCRLQRALRVGALIYL